MAKKSADDASELCGSVCLQLCLPDDESAADFLRLLGRNDTDARVESIIETDGPGNAVVPVDLGALTEKQREMMVLALETGYYERPRRTNLTELAAETGLSKSGVSERLNAAERNLVRETFGRFVETEVSPP
ncbi:helix-turn-helix domain-containing protein [Halobiforma nitratireducens]|uniref:Transcriptional regulator n=1 Tax=Halobiforma nitratireducens JCM 10879 TaxID=1227454 RepID=M0LAB4_9EURY|nr:helix-turn-helix domain-containing protein [Halobiforma nitratireducens]EMA30038.1 transcriptional regulator [Halobiforma nitratireducens JCM 10879]